jgi:hypothetical protein
MDFAALVSTADGTWLSSAMTSINLTIFLTPIVPEQSESQT